MTKADKLAKDIVATEANIFNLMEDKRRRVPQTDFTKLFNLVVQYKKVMRDSDMIHRSVASALSGFRELLMHYESRIPDTWLTKADRMETMIFCNYDSGISGDLPPGY